jgi:hypothetical protein
MTAPLTTSQHPVALALIRATGDDVGLFDPVIVETTDGRTIRSPSAIWGWVEGHLALHDRGNDVEIPFALVKRVSRPVLHIPHATLIVIGILAVGAALGDRLQPSLGYDAPTAGIGLGLIGAGLAAAVVVWLLQDLPWLKRYRQLYPPVDA